MSKKEEKKKKKRRKSNPFKTKRNKEEKKKSEFYSKFRVLSFAREKSIRKQVLNASNAASLHSSPLPPTSGTRYRLTAGGGDPPP